MTGANPILEGLEDEWESARRWTTVHFHPHRQPQTPASMPATMAAAPAAAAKQEDTMITVAEIENDAKALAAKFEQVDKAALAKLDAATANPETDDVLSTIAQLAGLPIPPGTIASFGGGLKALLGLYATDPAQPQPQQQPVPAQ